MTPLAIDYSDKLPAANLMFAISFIAVNAMNVSENRLFRKKISCGDEISERLLK